MNFDLMVDLHRNFERQGPGSNESTLKALSFIALPQGELSVADLGCGTGSAALVLSKMIKGEILAVDLFPKFLEELEKRKIDDASYQQIKTKEASIDQLNFVKESLDLIWSEGAVYNIGFQKGLELWRPFLKEGGYMALSEITWKTSQRPKALEDFWNEAYPEVDTASNKIKQIAAAGYVLKGYFELPIQDWMEHYYLPLESGFDSFLERNGNSEEAKQMVQMHQEEMDFYKKYKDYYSYGFYVMQKLG